MRFYADHKKRPKKGYKAEQADDGTWTIFDVPVFAAHTDERGSEPIEFSTGWLKRALRKAQTREGEGYLPPLHIRHHGDPQGVQAAGKFRLTRVGDFVHGGDPVSTLFADLVGVRPETYNRIRKGELSYRSVEILDCDVPEIDSLALLDDEVPFFRFGCLKITEETPAQKAAKKSLVLHYSAKGAARGITFNFNQHNGDESQGLKKMEDMEYTLEDIGKMLYEVLEHLKGEKPAEEDEAEEGAEMQAASEPAIQKEAAPVEVGVPGSNAFEAAGAQAAQSAQIKSLQAEIAEMKAAARVEKYASELRGRGYSAELVDQYKSTAAQFGEVAAKQFAKGIELNGPAEPPRTWTGEIVPSDAPDSAEVQQYAAQGPEMLERARAIAKSHARTGSTVPLGQYLAINLDSNSFLFGGE